MFAYLTIDQGNSSTKAALWHSDKIRDKLCVRDNPIDAIRQMIATSSMPVKTAVCSVGDSATDFKSALADCTETVIDINCHTPMPLKICYGTPETLGADRIAAAAGARSLCGAVPLLVADIGSASTFDHVSADGCFMGGNISPGLGMRLRALNSFTARLPLVDAHEGQVSLFSDNTREALRSGAVFGVVAELEYYARQLPANAKVVLTGGWADTISRHTKISCIISNNLVLAGLKSILAYNEAINNEAKISC